MRKRYKFLIALTCLAVLVAAVRFLNRETQPVYEGRTLEEWLVRAAREPYGAPESSKATEAVLAAGTNAVPLLLRWIQREPPVWRRAALRLLPDQIARTSFGQYLINGSGLDLASEAVLVFPDLGTNAVAAIPALQGMMKDRTRPRTAQRAISVLSCLGSPALGTLLEALSDTNHPYRDRIVTYSAVFMSMAPDVGTNAMLPHLQAALADPDPAVRSAASRQLSRLSPKPPTNAPAADPGN